MKIEDLKNLREGNIIEFNMGTDRKEYEACNLDNIIFYKENPDLLFCIEPIPLTEEWLVKFGFEHEYIEFVGNVYAIDTNVGNISLSIDKGIRTLDIYGVELESVHQLQNLFLCLTGKELTIKE